MRPIQRHVRIEYKRAQLRALDEELNGLTGRFLSDAEQLRLRAITEDQDRLEADLRELGAEA